MKGLDNYFRTQLIRHQSYLDEPEDPEPVPCVYCSHDLDDNDDCHNPDCPNE
jgi:hypothetical protein